MELIVFLWITILWSVALLNLVLLLKIARQNEKWSMNLVCASIYTIVCAFRSFFPRIDAERICFFDSLLSYPFIGRFFATIAEISFAYQVSRYWFDLVMIDDQKSKVWIKKAIREFVFVVCTVAQGWCWLAVLTRNQFYHAIEESHWGLASAILTLSTMYFKWGKFDRQLMISCFGGIMYTLFMICIDVPMYIKKQSEIQLKVPIISISDGFSDSLTCGIITQKSEDWIDEMAWLTGYFSLGVWSSLYIASRNLEQSLSKNK